MSVNKIDRQSGKCNFWALTKLLQDCLSPSLADWRLVRDGATNGLSNIVRSGLFNSAQGSGMKAKLDLRVSPRSVQQEVVAKLKHAILSGMFQPGDRLVEGNLCALLGVSRPSLREALRGLQAERLIEFIPNRGPQIPVLSWKAAEEIYDV